MWARGKWRVREGDPRLHFLESLSRALG
jgi:hypothetical protein